MDKETGKQIFETLKRAQRVLVALPEHLSLDAAASGLGLALFLEKLEKEVVVASSGRLPNELKFLPGTDKLKQGLPKGRSFVIKIDTGKKQLEEISYQKNEEEAEIFLKAKAGEMFAASDVSFYEDKAPVDVIITLGAISLESLGKLFEDNADLFFETAKINIDNQAGNEYFGSINLVDLAAVSVAEAAHQLMEEFESELVDEDIATCLLAGIITQTNSFQHARTTPAAFAKASRLVEFGGRQQEIIRHIYKTKPLPRLKLWGRALARLQVSEPRSLVYSLLRKEDFEKSGSTQEEIIFALRDMAESLSGYKAAALLAELANGRAGLYLAAHPEISEQQLLVKLPGLKTVGAAPGRYRLMSVEFENSPLQEAENRLLKALED